MGKKVKFTGSRLLGRELRRLRGTRTLDEVSALTSSPPLSHHVTPVATPTLCQAETGTALPSLPTLYTLSVVYRVSMNQLMGYVVEERLSESTSFPTDPIELEAQFGTHLKEGRWFEALPLAVHAERSARSDREVMKWRGNRAACLQRMGMHQQAAWMLLECIESGMLTDRQLHVAWMNLAAVHGAAGWWQSADDALRRADEHASAATSEERLWCKFMRSLTLVEGHGSGILVGDACLRMALRLLEDAAREWNTDDKAGLGRLQLTAAQAHIQMGNKLVATRDLQRLLSDARRAGNVYLETHAALKLGVLCFQENRLLDAERHLQAAGSLLDENTPPDLAFEVNYALYKLTSKTRPSHSDGHLLRCDQLFPLLSARSGLVREYELLRKARQ